MSHLAIAQGDRRVRVLVLVDYLALAGAERFAVGVATRLPEDRFEVWVCSTRSAESSMVDELTRAGVHHVNLGRRRRFELLPFWALLMLMRKHHFDVLHAHKFGSNFWGALFGRLFRVPVVLAHEHTWSYEGQPLRRFLDGRVIGRLATRFIAVSAADRDRMIGVEKVPARKTVLIPAGYIPRETHNGGDLRGELGLDPQTPLIGTLAVLRPQKALGVMLDAHAQILQSHPRAVLVIAGEGECREALERRALELALDRDKVRFLGARPDADRVLRSLDVAVISSDFEGSPQLMFECMHHGTPLVSTAVGGICEVVEHERTGLLVPPRDPAALADAVSSLLGDPARRAAMASAARAKLGPYRIEAIAQRFAALYDALLADRVNGSGA